MLRKHPPAVVWCNRRTLFGLTWLIGFCVFFFSFGLPNNPPASRWDIAQLVPTQLLEIVWPLPNPQAPPSGWKYLPQRLPAIGIAAAILGAALGFGLLVLQLLRLSREFPVSERLYFAGGVGLSLWSLITLACGLAGLLSPLLFWTLIIGGNGLLLWQCRRPPAGVAAVSESSESSRIVRNLVLLICVPIVWAMLLGACTPQADFDVVEYHLNGPKEWFQQGRISFLPHNVYTSFPFLTEMLVLSGMVLRNDWHAGALAGQIALMAFAPLTALGLYCAGRRWFSTTAGWLAALVFLTTPWTYRISIIAYAEGGLSYYLLASFLAAGFAVTLDARRHPPHPAEAATFSLQERRNELCSARAAFLLTGFLAGSAMACKYPGLTSVVIPITLGLAIVLIRRRVSPRVFALSLLAYGLGILLAVGPWLLKNTVETGNPVYPLAYSVFGGRDIDPELNAKWVHGHAAKTYPSIAARLKDGVVKLTDIVANNDWHSPLLYGLAPLSLCWALRRKEVFWAWLFIGWLFLTWFLLTHHIDRFWVPMIPIVALLAGAGAATLTTPVGKWIGGAVVIGCIGFNLTICSLIGGYNSGLTDLRSAEQIAEASLTPELHWLNEEYAAGRLPRDFKLLCVGEALTFHAKFPVLYHTVFNRCLLEEWCAVGPGPDFPLKSAEEIRRILHEYGVTHVFVNWRWILTYREPGNYGYTDFVHPDRLHELQKLGILGPVLKLPDPLGNALLTDARRTQLKDWAPSLIIQRERQPAYISCQIFPVR